MQNGWSALFGDREVALPRRLVLTAAQVEAIRSSALAAYPNEGCGLLVGEADRVTRVVPSPNVAEQGRDRFEIDPRVRLSLMKTLRGTSERLIGHWHSHPDAEPAPSATDLAHAYEPALIWVICGVSSTGKTALKAWKLAENRAGFSALPMVVTTEMKG